MKKKNEKKSVNYQFKDYETKFYPIYYLFNTFFCFI